MWSLAYAGHKTHLTEWPVTNQNNERDNKQIAGTNNEKAHVVKTFI